ncbi:hypothetical protein [Halosimplex halobium]|uniref:hypothetical protein n=1 Tax=Halosimplex halobium TaxID=3396618 RepID=UPI003F570418
MQKEQEPSLKELAVYLFFRYHAYIFLAAFLLAPIAILAVNTATDPTIYQNMMLGIGWTQAVITGYLSFKIFEVSKRDSELPDLKYKIADVEDVGSPFENHKVIRCTVRFRNQSFGRAKITDIDLNADFDERLLERHKVPGEGKIAHTFPEGRPIPTILDKGEYVDVMFQINGFNYLDSVSLEITDEKMGTWECGLLLSDISYRLSTKRRGRESEETVEEDAEETAEE